MAHIVWRDIHWKLLGVSRWFLSSWESAAASESHMSRQAREHLGNRNSKGPVKLYLASWWALLVWSRLFFLYNVLKMEFHQKLSAVINPLGIACRWRAAFVYFASKRNSNKIISKICSELNISFSYLVYWKWKSKQSSERIRSWINFSTLPQILFMWNPTSQIFLKLKI